MNELPREVFFDILVKLSIKDLLRYKCVSKYWFSTISDAEFVNYHRSKVNNRIQYISTEGIEYELPNQTKYICTSFLEVKEDEKENKIELLSSCNGLLLAEVVEKGYYLWNPSTRIYAQIDSTFDHCRTDDDRDIRYIRLYGLGYDSVTGTYKVIRIIRTVCRKRNYDTIMARVYNCKTKCWKKIGDFPYKPVVNGQGTVINGALHWIVTRKYNEHEFVIIYFDMVNDVIKEVKTCLPYWLIKSAQFRFGVLEGSMCLVRNNRDVAEVWVMKDYDNNASWTRLISIILTKTDTQLFKNLRIFDKIMKDGTPFYRRESSDEKVKVELVERKDKAMDSTYMHEVFLRTRDRLKDVVTKLYVQHLKIQHNNDMEEEKNNQHNDDSEDEDDDDESLDLDRYLTFDWSNLSDSEDDKIQALDEPISDDDEYDFLSFDGPISDTVFDRATYVTSLVSPR